LHRHLRPLPRFEWTSALAALAGLTPAMWPGEIVERQIVFSPSRVTRARGLRGERRPWPRAASSRTPREDASRTRAGCVAWLGRDYESRRRRSVDCRGLLVEPANRPRVRYLAACAGGLCSTPRRK